MLDYDVFLKNFRRNPGASAEDVHRTNEELGPELPSDYVDFLRHCDGGTGMIGEQYLVLWTVRSLAEMNQMHVVEKCAPELLLVGTNGAGEAFAFDKRTTPWPLVVVPLIGLDLEDAIVVALSFEASLQKMASGIDIFD